MGTSGSTAESQIDQMIAASHDVDAYPAQAVDAGALAYAPGAEGSMDSEGQPSFPTVAEPDLGPLAVWSGGFVDFGERDGGGLDLDHTTVGVSGGVDYRFSDDLVAGLGVGYGFDRTDIGVNGTENAARAYSAALYGSYSPTAGLFIDGLFGGSLMDHDSTRYVAANGEFATGSRSGCRAHGHTSAWANISKPITTNGGNSTKRHPVSAAATSTSARNPTKPGTHA